ncbi:hypothetical protein P3T16_002171 [Paraburkholderia sp. GAS42]|jgi:hypothetical protein
MARAASERRTHIGEGLIRTVDYLIVVRLQRHDRDVLGIKVKIPADTGVDAEVDLATARGAYFLQARLNAIPRMLRRTVCRDGKPPVSA